MDFDQTANAMGWTQMQTALKELYNDAAERQDAKGMVKTSMLMQGLDARQSEMTAVLSVVGRQDRLMNQAYPEF